MAKNILLCDSCYKELQLEKNQYIKVEPPNLVLGEPWCRKCKKDLKDNEIIWIKLG